MSKKFDEAEVTGKYVSDLVRKRALAALSKHEGALDAVLTKVAEGIRKDLRAVGFTVEQVRGILQKHLAGTAAERAHIIEQAIIDAAREARTLDKQTFEAVFGPEEVAKVPAPLGPSSKVPKLRSVSPPPVSGEKPPSTD